MKHTRIQTALLASGFIGLLLCCKPSNNISKQSPSSNSQQGSGNNVISIDSENTQSSPDSKDEIIFEGSNNLFELVQKNSLYFDKSHDVIIIKGNNTIIRLINVNVLDLSTGRSDTLVIVGSNEKYVIDINNSISTNDRKVRTDIIYLKEKPFDPSSYANDFTQNDIPIRLDYFDSLVTAKYAYSYFSEKLLTGDPLYFYELAEMYLYGLGVNESSLKAIELYEYAGVRNHVPSLTKLGDIFTGKFGVKRNKEKALYYYKRCGELGEQYCNDQIKELQDK